MIILKTLCILKLILNIARGGLNVIIVTTITEPDIHTQPVVLNF